MVKTDMPNTTQYTNHDTSLKARSRYVPDDFNISLLLTLILFPTDVYRSKLL